MDAQAYPGNGLSLSQLAFALNEELKRTAYSPFFTFDDISQLDRDISAALANIREWRNSFVRVNRIPLDILALVPTHLPFQKDHFRASHVCRHWRRTFLQHAALWSKLYLSNGEVYAKTLLERAKGSALDIVARFDNRIDVIRLLPPHAQQIKCLYFVYNHWMDIQRFSEINSGPLPLLRSLTINVVDEFSLDHPNVMTPPSLPLFANAVNLRVFSLHSERFPFLGHFVFPNLTTFELSAAPEAEGFRALELLNFMEASPMLRTVLIKIIAEIRLGDVPRGKAWLQNGNSHIVSFREAHVVYTQENRRQCHPTGNIPRFAFVERDCSSVFKKSHRRRLARDKIRS
ncbi:hypothetical protein BDM02DRAFT_225932 [Thelephora ganbajun]|uniref:Uncharacterized protein n=1 Tax=Thelephora ganbajun TaxID=370292 RepID=A0ACB6ZRF5_THEGA|nr:hypothetical protein BDM02DRAFT_225932 [Thelephora ganbajun]